MAAYTGVSFGVLVAFLLLRFLPLWPQRHRGCDAYYFLLTAEAVRRSRWRLPIELAPLYLLEDARQYYPPAFSLLLGLFPDRTLRRDYWIIAHVLDLPVLAAVTVWTGVAFGIGWGALAGLAYGLSPFLVTEYANLTSRPLGHLFFLGFAFASWGWVEGPSYWLPVAVVAGVLLLYAHKLAVQLLWFLVPVLALGTGDWRWLLPLPLAYFGAAAVAPRYFWQLQRAHADIVAFWTRNWPLLGAHAVADSPVYGSGERAAVGEFHGPSGVRRAARYAYMVLRHHPWLIVAVAGVVYDWPSEGAAEFAFWWLVAVYAWATLTLALPVLRGLGEGTKYLKYGAVPVLFLSARGLADTPSRLMWALAAAAAAATLGAYALAARRMRQPTHHTGVIDDEFRAAVAPLHDVDDARVMCLPFQLADATAYTTRRPVLWGTHHYGFRNVEPVFPVLREPLPEVFERHGITHVLLDSTYVDPQVLGLGGATLVCESGRYRLIRVANTG